MPVCALLFCERLQQFFKFTIVCVIYFVADARAIFVGAYIIMFFFISVVDVLCFFLRVCDCV